jgi:hypothetical protein
MRSSIVIRAPYLLLRTVGFVFLCPLPRSWRPQAIVAILRQFSVRLGSWMFGNVGAVI